MQPDESPTSGTRSILSVQLPPSGVANSDLTRQVLLQWIVVEAFKGRLDRLDQQLRTLRKRRGESHSVQQSRGSLSFSNWRYAFRVLMYELLREEARLLGVGHEQYIKRVFQQLVKKFGSLSHYLPNLVVQVASSEEDRDNFARPVRRLFKRSKQYLLKLGFEAFVMELQPPFEATLYAKPVVTDTADFTSFLGSAEVASINPQSIPILRIEFGPSEAMNPIHGPGSYKLLPGNNALIAAAERVEMLSKKRP